MLREKKCKRADARNSSQPGLTVTLWWGGIDGVIESGSVNIATTAVGFVVYISATSMAALLMVGLDF